MKGTQLFLKPDEAKFLGMAVVDVVENLQNRAKDPALPWTPESRRTLREMIEAGTALRIKLGKLGIDVRDLPPYFPGDENEFLTKES